MLRLCGEGVGAVGFVELCYDPRKATTLGATSHRPVGQPQLQGTEGPKGPPAGSEAEEGDDLADVF